MSYKAKVIEVMIATPGDVTKERQLIGVTVYEWNFIHSKDKDLVLFPVGWESHASPAMGDRPQAIINKQVLKNCDLLIAAFWTRLGTPTGKAASGTVEEIEEHLKAGKPAMIYFSSVPAALAYVDPKQLKALEAFKETCRQKGLIEEYSSPEDLKEKLARQLAQTVLRHFVKKNGPPNASDLAYLKPIKIPKLSARAKLLLQEAAQDRRGEIVRYRTSRGLTVQTYDYDLAEYRDEHSDVKWEAALNELCDHGLIQDRGIKREVFYVTSKGFEVAELLPLQVAGATA